MCQEQTESKKTFWLAIGAIIISVVSLYVSCRADDRTERLYQAQRTSDIQVTPVSFESYLRKGENDEPMGRLSFKLINYTGFKASNVRVDANFAGVWLHEWIINTAKGLRDKKDKEGSLSEDLQNQLESYSRNSEQFTFELEPNDVKNIESFQGSFQYQKGKENKLIIRVSWDNENSAHFDKFYVFNIELTEAYDVRSYVLIPEAN